MWSGKKTLHEINGTMRSIRKDIRQFDTELNSLTTAITRNQQNQSQIIRSIARVRLNELDGEGAVEALDSADHTVMRLLARRDKTLAEVEEKIERTARELSALEEQRESLAENADSESEKVIQIEHEIQENLENDRTYQDQLEVAREADSVAEEAKAKAHVAVQDCTEKGVPYQNDPLFIYLWDRNFGTSEYKANLLTRFLDGWVARLCNFMPARANYWTLQEIPKRLIQHAKDARKLSNNAIEKLQALEAAAASDAGLPDAQINLKRAEQAIKEKDSEIEKLEDSEQDLLSQRAQLVSGEDPDSNTALTALAKALERNDFDEIEQKVVATQSREDDLLLRDLGELQAEVEDLSEDLRDGRKHRSELTRRLRELESVRRKFKRRRYDDVRSGFGKEELIASMLGQFVRGVIDGSDLWNTMKRHQRHRDVGAWPDFGSGGLGSKSRRTKPKRRSRAGTWHTPGRKSGQDFRLPRNGGFSSRGRGRSGGGFKTGGGF